MKNEPPLQIRVVGMETVNLIQHMRASVWTNENVWRERVPIIVHHFGDHPKMGLIYADLRKVLWRFSALKHSVGMRIVDPEVPPEKKHLPTLAFR